MKNLKTLVLAAVIFVGLFVWLNRDGFTAIQSAPAAPLAITAARGPLGFAVTNREGSPITRCDVTAHDGQTEWVADGPSYVAPLATVLLPWAAFEANGQPIPAYAGKTARFTVSCLVENDRRTAELGPK